MLGRLFSRRRKSVIGLDFIRGRYFAVRLEEDKTGTLQFCEKLDTAALSDLKSKLEPADYVVSRAPNEGFSNRRSIVVNGDWTDEEHLSFGHRGHAVFKECERFTPVPMMETVYGWRVLKHDTARGKSELEIHQAGGKECAQVLQPLESLKLGSVKLEARHCTALSGAIPSRYRWFLLETFSPDGFALVQEGHLVGHIPTDTFRISDPNNPGVSTFLNFLKRYQESGQPGALQLYYLTRRFRTPDLPGLSCSWIGHNCTELLGVELLPEYLQAVGLAMSDEKSWWLHHVSEFVRL